ncbi:hypothetical protein EJ357_17285 [Streptomyces cyaneochromogenes]|uniref:Uncharacterized protein n=1 Tax=Streptomyces cyaneochromogenes TaxID=2496836 RepID=A0A3S9M7A7_9ACTN|nr:hypothetical protein [Streptomyces cyaneochromogenes]AZQ35027.1 hypothetical protein EJ357_17285 [Streptomyces cyaneochromogenes]
MDDTDSAILTLPQLAPALVFADGCAHSAIEHLHAFLTDQSGIEAGMRTDRAGRADRFDRAGDEG